MCVFSDRCKAVLVLWVICVFCVSYAVAYVHCCLVVTCWERAGLLTIVGHVFCIFVTFPCGILCQVWYLVVLFPDLCRLSYFITKVKEENFHSKLKSHKAK